MVAWAIFGGVNHEIRFCVSRFGHHVLTAFRTKETAGRGSRLARAPRSDAPTKEIGHDESTPYLDKSLEMTDDE